jgi:hypothetical protein
MSEEELKKVSEQYDQMSEKFQKEKDEYVDYDLFKFLTNLDLFLYEI